MWHNINLLYFFDIILTKSKETSKSEMEISSHIFADLVQSNPTAKQSFPFWF
ncbi:hypothetical protein M058_03510 [Streptococcus mitis 17/34]|nr:hypothetical protein M058_03510 [Streptococcus mitis 17/34]